MKVLVTGTTRNAGLAITRGLGQAGCRVVGVDDRSLPFATHSRYAEFQYVAAGEGGRPFAGTLLEIARKEKPDVLLPVHHVRAIAARQQEFRGFTAMLLPAYDNFLAAYDNRTTHVKCRELGIPCPVILSEGEALALLQEGRDAREPARVVVKPRADMGGSRGLAMVSRPEALMPAKKRCEAEFGEAFISEYIPGRESMKTVNLLFDRRHRLAAYFTTQKLRQWPITGGQTAMSISTHEPELVEMVLPFFEKMKWRGPAEVELKVDCRDQTPKVIEINPRFWSYVGFPIRCGINFPYLLCQLAMADSAAPAGPPSYSRGVKYVNPTYYAKAVMAEFRGSRDRPASLARLWREVRGRKVSNNGDIRDWKVSLAKFLFELHGRAPGAELTPVQAVPF